MTTQEQQAQETTSAQAQANPTDVTQTQTDLQSQIAAEVAKLTDGFKKEISGLNRANSELQKKLQDKELEGLKESDRVAKELELAKAEKDRILSEAVSLKKQNAVVSKGLDPEFANLISGTNDDEISTSLNAIISQVEKEVAKRLEAKQKEIFGGPAPVAGQPPQNMTLQSMYDEAKKSNKIAQMTAIQRQATKEGYTLKI